MSRCLTVVDPGPLTTVQDRGRFGWRHLGVPRAGALDQPAAALANRLVGNVADAAVLETTLGGVAFTVSAAVSVAVTGTGCDVHVGDRAVAWGEPVSVPAGATVRVGAATWGVRSYVAVAGGLLPDAVLGSRSTDTLSWVGHGRLVEGTTVPVGRADGAPRPVDVAVHRPPARPAVLRYVAGPREEWFTAPWTLGTSTYTVQGESNRVGLRLAGPSLERRRRGELPSEGIVLGAIQVPASGQPLVFLNDHPTTGGYPVVGVVVPGDLPLCAQLRPGDEVRFRPAGTRSARDRLGT
ncbi:MAG: 5-oxoprolinase subunit C family protein [Nocardioidaceae bacterium]